MRNTLRCKSWIHTFWSQKAPLWPSNLTFYTVQTKGRKRNQIRVNLNLEQCRLLCSTNSGRTSHAIHVTLGNNRFTLFLSSSESAAFPSHRTLPKTLLLPQCKGRNVPSRARLSGSVGVLVVPPVPVPTGRQAPLKLRWHVILPHAPGMSHTFLPRRCCATPPAAYLI